MKVIESPDLVKLESHKRVNENKDFYNAPMLFEDTKTLEFNQYQKFDKSPFIIYAYLECVIENIEGCKNDPENSPTTKVSKHYINFYNMII